MHRFIKIRIIRDLEHLEERKRGWRERLFPLGEVQMPFRPAMDLYETTEGLVLRLEIPGAVKEDLAVDLVGQELIIRGQRRPTPPAQVTRVLNYEITYGNFERSFHIPIPIDPEGIKARYREGILEVKLPHLRPRARRIAVKEVRETKTE